MNNLKDFEDILALLRIIETRGGTIGLNISKEDLSLSNVDLSALKITEYLNKQYNNNIPIEKLPPWFVEVPRTTIRGEAFWRGEHRDKDNRILSPKEILSSYRFRLNLRGVILSGVDFSNSKLQCIDLTDADLAEANFTNANMWSCVLDNANLLNANLNESYLVYASLQDTVLNNVSMQFANLSYANLKNSSLKNADLKSATFYGADFSNALLFSSNLNEASIWRADLQSAKIDQTIIERGLIQENDDAWQNHVAHHWEKDKESIKINEDLLKAQEGKERSYKRRYLEASNIYRELRRNFTYNGDYLSSSIAYSKSRNMERKTHHPKHARNCYGWLELSKDHRNYSPTILLFHIKHIIKWLLDWIAFLTSGYGEKPLRTLIWGVFTLIVFPFLYYFSGGLTSTNGRITLVDYFNYSAACFTTIGFNQYIANSYIAQTLTYIEAFIGISIIALLMFSLGKRISRS